MCVTLELFSYIFILKTLTRMPIKFQTFWHLVCMNWSCFSGSIKLKFTIFIVAVKSVDLGLLWDSGQIFQCNALQNQAVT